MTEKSTRETITTAGLTYLPAFVGAGVWAFAKFPEQLRWAAAGYAKAFGILSSIYDEWTHVGGYGAALDDALSEVQSVPNRALDLATGTGFAARLIKRRFPEAEVIGTDITPEMIAVAQHQAVADGLKIEFEVTDSSALPFDDEWFDLVVLQNSIVYPEEMMRVVAPGGRAIIVFSFAGPWVKLAWPALKSRLEAAGAEYVWDNVAGAGFFGVARKGGQKPHRAEDKMPR